MKAIKSIVLLCVITSGIGAHGQTANLEFGTGTTTTPQTIFVTPGSTFSTTLYLTTSSIPSGAGGLTFDLLASDSDFLSLTSRDYVGSGSPPAFVDPTQVTTSNATLFPGGAPALVDPSTGRDLGGATSSALPDGTYYLTTFSFDIAPSTPFGDYSLGIVTTGSTAAMLANSDFTFLTPIGTSGLTIDVVPEPSSFSLILMSSVLLSLFLARRTTHSGNVMRVKVDGAVKMFSFRHSPFW